MCGAAEHHAAEACEQVIFRWRGATYIHIVQDQGKAAKDLLFLEIEKEQLCSDLKANLVCITDVFHGCSLAIHRQRERDGAIGILDRTELIETEGKRRRVGLQLFADARIDLRTAIGVQHPRQMRKGLFRSGCIASKCNTRKVDNVESSSSCRRKANKGRKHPQDDGCMPTSQKLHHVSTLPELVHGPLKARSLIS